MLHALAAALGVAWIAPFVEASAVIVTVRSGPIGVSWIASFVEASAVAKTARRPYQDRVLASRPRP